MENRKFPEKIQSYFLSCLYNQTSVNNQKIENALTYIEKYYEERDDFYIYHIKNGISSQKGLLGLIEISPGDIGKKIIIPHEDTCPKKVNYYFANFCKVKEQQKPLLLFYKSKKKNLLLYPAIKKSPFLEIIDKSSNVHQLWNMSEDVYKKSLLKPFDEVEKLYIADGHHRFEAIKHYYAQCQSNMPVRIMSYIVSEHDLSLYPFGRIVTNISKNMRVKLIDILSRNFFIKKLNKYTPSNLQYVLSMYFCKSWFFLCLKRREEKLQKKLGIQILSEYVLKSIFLISDQRNDFRVKFITPLSCQEVFRYQNLVDNHHGSIMFLVSRFSIHQLQNAVKENEILPPHSTCFKYKPLTGFCRFNIG